MEEERKIFLLLIRNRVKNVFPFSSLSHYTVSQVDSVAAVHLHGVNQPDKTGAEQHPVAQCANPAAGGKYKDVADMFRF